MTDQRFYITPMLLAAILAIGFLLGGCDGDSSDSSLKWTVHSFWPTGSLPVPSPNGTAVLFSQEEAPSGLYLLRDGIATRVNPAGPDIRADYAWSADGQTFTFSSPGLAGEGAAGIYVAESATPTVFQKVWDRGS
ncbi:hypothetical protein EHM69_08650, partial [candidate division KSB1 bacterium]